MINLNNYTYIQHHLVDFIPENKYHKKKGKQRLECVMQILYSNGKIQKRKAYDDDDENIKGTAL